MKSPAQVDAHTSHVETAPADLVPAERSILSKSDLLLII
jgi:hypothetical protein